MAEGVDPDMPMYESGDTCFCDLIKFEVLCSMHADGRGARTSSHLAGSRVWARKHIHNHHACMQGRS